MAEQFQVGRIPDTVLLRSPQASIASDTTVVGIFSALFCTSIRFHSFILIFHLFYYFFGYCTIGLKYSVAPPALIMLNSSPVGMVQLYCLSVRLLTTTPCLLYTSPSPR